MKVLIVGAGALGGLIAARLLAAGVDVWLASKTPITRLQVRGVGGDAFLPAPDMDLKETPEQIELTVELPGLKPEDVSVTLEDGVLTVSGEKRGESDETRKGYRMVERRFGAFSRSVRLPAGVVADKVEASLKEGVLKVTAPRDGVAAARKVPIETAKA